MSEENWEKKYLKYKKKYLDLKHSQHLQKSQKSGMVPVAVINNMSTRGRTYNTTPSSVPVPVPVVRNVSDKLKKDDYIINTCVLIPDECIHTFNNISREFIRVNIPSLKSSPTNEEIIVAYNNCKKFIYGIVLATIILILITKNIYVFNNKVIPYLRDPIDNRKSNFDKCYNQFKRLNIVAGKEYIKQGTFINSKVNSLIKILEEHRLYTVGLSNESVVDRLPSPNQELTKDALANLILDFRIGYADTLKYLNNPCVKKYIGDVDYCTEVKHIFELSLELKNKSNINGDIIDIEDWQTTLQKELADTANIKKILVG
jgi:hypothetical protein